MTIKAYLLINTYPGMADDVSKHLHGMVNVTDAHRVTGPYDVIAVVQVDDLYALGAIIGDGVHMVPGVKSTMTCIRARE